MSASTSKSLRDSLAVSVLYGIFGLSLALLALKLLGGSREVWETYYKIYLGIAIIHTWYVFALLFIGDVRKRAYPKYAGESMAIIIPVYNEEPALLEASIRSALKADGNKRILVIDDGSTDPGVKIVLSSFKNDSRVTVRHFERNKGKREAIHEAVTYLLSGCDFVVTIDSDTIMRKDALIRLVEPLKTASIGASTGDVRLLNEHENLLTSMIGSYYWSALNIQRKANSSLGMVDCCSGALSAYKAEIAEYIKDDLVSEEFLSKKCVYSDDRHLTNLVLRLGFDVVYVEKAIAYTNTPSTMGQFVKQQLRWRRGFFQEAIFSLSFLWKMKPVLFIEVLIWDLIMPLASVGIIFLVFANSIVDPAFFFFGVVPSLILLLVVRNFPLVYHAPKKIPGIMLYTFFSHFIMYWVGLYALFTLKTQRWSTR